MRLKSGPIRVMIVEDSPTARGLLVALFSQASDFQVVGTALDGEEAVQRAIELHPDVITMDIQMPRLNGLEATRRILQLASIPIVMVTASLNRPDMDLTFEAIRAGALTVVKKPSFEDPVMCEQVVQTVRLMADVQVVRRFNQTNRTAAAPGLPASASRPPNGSLGMAVPPPAARYEAQKSNRQVIGVASSTGGPNALVNMLRPLPADFPLPILVVQHITSGFAPSLADWLNGELRLHVRLAVQGESLAPGTVLIAPDDRHMQVSDRKTILLHSSPPYKGLRPSANYLFFSLARVYGQQSVGVILTGMGDDGVEGLSDLHGKGGLVLAQDEASCVVYGMPREAAIRNIVDHVLPADEIGLALHHLWDRKGKVA